MTGRLLFVLLALFMGAVIAVAVLTLLSATSAAAHSCRSIEGAHWDSTRGTCTWGAP